MRNRYEWQHEWGSVAWEPVHIEIPPGRREVPSEWGAWHVIALDPADRERCLWRRCLEFTP